jgi:hypothetical protein
MSYIKWRAACRDGVSLSARWRDSGVIAWQPCRALSPINKPYVLRKHLGVTYLSDMHPVSVDHRQEEERERERERESTVAFSLFLRLAGSDRGRSRNSRRGDFEFPSEVTRSGTTKSYSPLSPPPLSLPLPLACHHSPAIENFHFVPANLLRERARCRNRASYREFLALRAQHPRSFIIFTYH